MKPGVHAKGFTLIELMIVVAIIGLLASSAVPLFTNIRYRAMRAERTANVAKFVQAVTDYYNANNNSFPTTFTFGGGFSLMIANWNPDISWPFTPKEFNAAMPVWNQLSFSPMGNVRYRYYLVGETGPGMVPWFYILVYGDLDGDNIWDYYEAEYMPDPNVNELWRPVGEWSSPVGTW